LGLQFRKLAAIDRFQRGIYGFAAPKSLFPEQIYEFALLRIGLSTSQSRDTFNIAANNYLLDRSRRATGVGRSSIRV